MPRILSVSIVLGGSDSSVGQLVWDDTRTTGSHSQMAFQYDERWLAHGFSLGADLPLTPGIHYPFDDLRNPDPVLRSRNDTFGFVADHDVGQWLLGVLEQAHLKGLKSTFIDLPASPADLWVAVNTQKERFSALSLPQNLSASSNTDLLGFDRKVPINTAKSLADLGKCLELSVSGHQPSSVNAMGNLLLHAAPFLGSDGKLLVTTGRPTDLRDWVVRTQSAKSPFNTVLWRAVTSRLAQKCGLDIVDCKLLNPSLYAEERFDKDSAGEAIYCASAATLVGRKTSAFARLKPMAMSYLDVADILNREGANAAEDLRELYARLLFNTLTANHHDRLDQFWFGRLPTGWTLLPMYCPCAQPAFLTPRLLSTPVRQMQISADSENAIAVSRYFGVKTAEAKSMRLEFMHALSGWKSVAEELGADQFEISQMQGAFDDY